MLDTQFGAMANDTLAILKKMVKFADFEEVAKASLRETFAPRKVMRCSEWASEHFYLSGESSAISGKFTPFEYQRVMLDVWGGALVETCDVVKSSRVGFTKSETALMGYAVDYLRRNLISYHPSDPKALEFVKLHVNPLIFDSQRIFDLLAENDEKVQGPKGGRSKKVRRGEHNTMRTKKFKTGSVLHILGASNANNFRSLQADYVVFDEVDGFPFSIGLEGDALSLGDMRVFESPFKFSLRGTTPTTEQTSVIRKSEMNADMRFQFRVPCQAGCGELEPLEWWVDEGDDAPEHGMRWEDGKPNTVHHVCKFCGGKWYWSSLRKAVAGGRWETDGGIYINPENTFELRDGNGKRVKWPDHIAMVNLWAAYSPLMKWADIVKRYLGAKNDIEKLRTFRNTILGKYWKDIDIEIFAEDLANQCEGYLNDLGDGRFAVDAPLVVVTAGVDVQEDRLEAEICGWGIGRESWSLGYKIIEGDPMADDVWHKLNTWARDSVFINSEGEELGVAKMVVDSGHLAERVYKFCRQGTRDLIPAKGWKSSRGHMFDYRRQIDKEKKTRFVNYDPDLMKDILFRYFQREDPGPGYCHFPVASAYGDMYFGQLASQQKREVRTNAGRYMKYVNKDPGVRDEALDCRMYCLLSVLLLEREGSIDLSYFEDQPEEESEAEV